MSDMFADVVTRQEMVAEVVSWKMPEAKAARQVAVMKAVSRKLQRHG